MADIRIEKLADVLVRYSVAVKPGDKVVITGQSAAAPLIRAVYQRVLQAGGYPFVLASLPGIEELFFRYASEEQLQHVPEPLQLLMEQYDVRISIGAEENTKSLSQVAPSRIALRRRALGPLMQTFMRRSAAGELRWVVTLFPTNAYAQDAEMSLEEYEDFVYCACLLDTDDPVEAWRDLSRRQQSVVEWLKGKDCIHVVGPETDLWLSVAGRTFINSDGHHNMPCGEVFTGPVEESVEGHVMFSYPAITEGREVTGVRLWFERGQVVKATAEKNEAFLLKMLDTDEGARRVGEFAIGTNYGITRFTRQILFDEKIGGSFHLALGAGYPETGSRNESSVHWDLISDLRHGGEIWVDGQLLYRDGQFMIDF